jgi:hypothetical protein
METLVTPYDTAKEIFSRALPSAVLRPQASSDWRGEFLLPDPVAEYFRELGPVDVSIQGYGNPYFLPSLSQLWSFQAGYRYHPSSRERFPEWDEAWLVIASDGGDPFIFSRSSGAVLHAYHGAGVWEPDELFGSLADMVTIFAIIGEIAETAGLALTDDDSMILPRYREDASRRIGEFLRSPEEAEVILQSLGWG